MADELRRQGICGLSLHTWQMVIGVSVARAEQIPVQVLLPIPFQKLVPSQEQRLLEEFW